MRKTGLLAGCFALIFWTPTKGLGSESQRSFFSESPFGNILLHRSSSAREEDQRPLASRQTTHIPALSTGYRKTFKANSVAPGNHRELLQPPGEDQVLGRYFSNRLSHSALVDLDSLLNVSQDVLTEALNLANFTSRQYDRDFGGVTPRKDFDELDQLIDQIQVSSEILKNSTTSLRDLPRQLKQLSTQLHSIFEKFYGLVNLTNNSKAFSGVCHKIVTSAYIIDRCYEKLRQISLKISIFAKKMSQEALLAHVLMKNYAEKDLEEVFLFEQLREILFELCRIQNRIIILLKRQSHVSLQLNEEVELLQENYEQFRLILNGSKGQINKRISLISNLMEKINNISVVSLDLLDIKNYHFHNKSKEDFPHLENKLFLGEKMNSSLCGQSSLKIPICAKPSLLKCIGKECATIPSEKEYDINLKAHESDGVKRPPGLIVPTLLDQVAESTSKKTMDFNNELHLTKAIDQVTFVHLTTRENQTGSITPRPNMDFYYSSTRYNEYPGVKHGSTKNPQLDLDEYPYPKLNYPQIHKDRAKDSKFDADRTLPQLSKTTSHFVTPNITVNFAESIDEISTQSPKSYLYYKQLVSGDNNFTFAPTQVLDHAKHLAGPTPSPLVNQQQQSTSRQKIDLKTEPSPPKMIDLVTLLTTTTNTTGSNNPRPNIDFYYSYTRYNEYSGVKHGSTKNPQLALDEHPYPKLNYPQIHEDSQEDSKFDADMTLPQLSKTTSKLATPNITVNFAESIDDISTQLPKSYLCYKELVSGDNNFPFAPTHALDHAMHLAGSTPSPLVNQQQESTSRQKIDLKTEPSPPKMVDLLTLLTTSTNPTGSITPRPNIDFHYSSTRYDKYPSVKHGSTINPQLAIDEHPYPKLNYPQVHKDVAEDSKFDADRTLPQFGKTTSHFAVPNITVNFEESIDDISTQSSKSYLYYKELVSGDDNFVFAPTHVLDHTKHLAGPTPSPLVNQEQESTSRQKIDLKTEPSPPKMIDLVTLLTTTTNATGSITPRPNIDFYYSSTRYKEYPGVKHGSTINPQLALDEHPYPKLNYPQIHKDRAEYSKFDADGTLPQLRKTTSHFVTPNITVNFAESIDEISTQSPKSYLYYKELVSGDNNFTFAPIHVLDHAKHLPGSTPSPIVNQKQESTSRQKIDLKTEPSPPKMIDLVTLLTTTTNTTGSITPRPNIDFSYSSTRYNEYSGVKHGFIKNLPLALDEHPYLKLNYPQIHKDSQEDSKFDADMTLPQLSKTTSKLVTPNITVNFAESIDDISTQLPKSYLYYKELVSGDNNFPFAPTHALDHAMHLAGSTPSQLVNQQQESTSRQKIDLKTEPSPPKMVDLVTLLTTSTNPTGSITPRPNIDFYYSSTRYDEYPSVKHGSTINSQLAIDEHPYPKLNYPQIHKDVAEDSKFDADRTLPQFSKTTSHFAVPNITVNFEESIDDISTQSPKSYLYYKQLVSGDNNFLFAPTHVLDHTKHLAGSTPSPLVNQEQESTSRQKIDLKTEPSPPKMIDLVTLLTTTTNATGSITPRPNIDFYYSSTRYKEYPGVKHGSTINPQLALDEHPYPKLNYAQIHKDRAEDSKFDADGTLPQLRKTTSHFVTPNITVNFTESIAEISTQSHVLDHAKHLAGSTPSPLVNQEQQSTSRQKIDLKTEPSPPKIIDRVTLLTTTTNTTGSITPRPNVDFYYSSTQYNEYLGVKHGSTINPQLAIDEHPYPKLNYPQIHKDRAEDSTFDVNRTRPQLSQTTSHFVTSNITVNFAESINDISTQSQKSYPYYNKSVYGDNNFVFVPTHDLNHAKQPPGLRLPTLVDPEAEITSMKTIDLNTKLSPPKKIDLVTLLTTTTNPISSITPRSNIDFYFSNRYHNYPGDMQGSTITTQLGLDKHSYPKNNDSQIHKDTTEDFTFATNKTLPKLNKSTRYFITSNITVNFEVSTQSPKLYSYYNESVSGYNNRTIPKLNKSTSHFVTSNITVSFEESTNQISTKLQNVYPNYPDSVLGDKDFKFIPTTHATVTQTSNYTVVNETNKISDQINVHIHPSQKDDSFTSSTSNVTQSNAMVQTTLPPDIHPKLDSNRQTNLNYQSSDWLIKDLSPKEAGPGNLSIFPMRGRGYLNTPTNVSSVDKATHSLPSNVSTVNVYFTTNISIIKSTNSPKEIKDGSASNLKENSTKVSTDPTMVNGSISIFNLQYQMLPTNNSSPIENSSISELPLDSTANPFTASTLPKPRQKEKFMPVQFIPRENNHENTTNFESIGSRIFVPHFHGTSDTSIQINNTIYKTKMFNLWSSWKSKEITTLHSLLLSPPQTKEDLNITPEEEEEIIEESEMDYNYDSKDDYKDFESYRKYAKKFSMEHLVNLDIQDILELDLTSTTTLEPLQDQYTTMLDLMTPEEEELPKYDSVSYQTTSGNEDCDKTEAVLGTCKIIMYHHKRPTESDWNLSLICPCTMPSYEGTCPKKIQKGTEYIINICRVAVSA